MSDATDGIAQNVDGQGCVDENECREDQYNVCGPAATGHWCANVDVLTQNTDADTDTNKAVRTPTNGYKMYECKCQQEGVFFKLTSNGVGDDTYACENVDYCLEHGLAEPPCGTDPNIVCVDVQGQTDFSNTNAAGVASTARTRAFNCECADGYEFKEKDDGTFECADIDECDVDAPTHNCVGAHTKCTNTVGSFTCDCDTTQHEAGQGVMNGDGTECIDFESCTGDSNECYDKDFNAHGVCTEGTFEPPTCSCAAGWEQVPIPDGGAADPTTDWPATPHSTTQVGTCNKNIDECVATPDICDGRDYTTCLDNAGSYECQCNDGYSRDGSLVPAGVISVAADGQGCFNVNECSDSNFNDCDETTANCNDNTGDTPGYYCTCKLSAVNAAGGTSIIMAFPDPSDDKTACQDIDECAYTGEENNPCGAGLDCTNVVCTDGTCLEGYTCSCPDGTEMILEIVGATYKKVCRNTNECEVFESNSCNANAGVICTDGDVLATPAEDMYTCSCGNGMETQGTGTDMICINKLECNDSPCGGGAAVSCVDVDASLTLSTRTVSGVEIEASWGLPADEAGYTCGCTTCGDDATQYYTYDAAESKCSSMMS